MVGNIDANSHRIDALETKLASAIETLETIKADCNDRPASDLGDIARDGLAAIRNQTNMAP